MLYLVKYFFIEIELPKQKCSFNWGPRFDWKMLMVG